MTSPRAEPCELVIRDASIRLGQFLKLAGFIDSGADAKSVIADGEFARWVTHFERDDAVHQVAPLRFFGGAEYEATATQQPSVHPLPTDAD